ncbi:MAG: hypothetical protein ABIH23_15470 [bacterium]
MCARPLLLAAVLSLSLLFSLPVIALAGEQPEQSYAIYESELNRLLEIWTQLEMLNEKLSQELTTLQSNSERLTTQLSESRAELSRLRGDLASLSADCETLRQQLLLSQKESEMLQTALRLADSSLTRLETSFSEYRNAAQSQIKRLTRQKNIAWIVSGILAVLSFI